MSNNDLTALPSTLSKLKDTLRVFQVEGNPLTDPPPDIVAQGCNGLFYYIFIIISMIVIHLFFFNTLAILGYLRDTTDGAGHKAPVRVIVLGNRGAGKTSLIQAMTGNRFVFYFILFFLKKTTFNCCSIIIILK